MAHCINCGKPIDPKDKFCINCGRPLEAEEQTSSKEDDAEARRKEEESTKKAEEEKRAKERAESLENERLKKESAEDIKRDITPVASPKQDIAASQPQSYSAPKVPTSNRPVIVREEKPRSNIVVWVLSIFLVLLVIGAGVLGSMLMGASDKYDTLEAQHTTTVDALNQANEVVAESNSTISDLEDDISDLDNQVGSLTAENSDLQDELDDINEVFPPRNFYSYSELNNWVISNGVSGYPYASTIKGWYTKGMELQQDALNDGYIVSVDIDTDSSGSVVWCVAVIGDTMYYWDPELTDLYSLSLNIT